MIQSTILKCCEFFHFCVISGHLLKTSGVILPPAGKVQNIVPLYLYQTQSIELDSGNMCWQSNYGGANINVTWTTNLHVTYFNKQIYFFLLFLKLLEIVSVCTAVVHVTARKTEKLILFSKICF